MVEFGRGHLYAEIRAGRVFRSHGQRGVLAIGCEKEVQPLGDLMRGHADAMFIGVSCCDPFKGNNLFVIQFCASF